MNIDIKITPRLKMVADMVEKCSIVCDVGTDHGYLPIYLVKHGICERAIAADVNEGPLLAAKKNIANVQVRDRIETRLSDGLAEIEHADCVTIAGMGGELIATILKSRKKSMVKFVLQPQRSFDVLRYYLAQNGFTIEKEAVCSEGEKMYCALCARYTGEVYSIEEKEALLGNRSLFENDCEYKKYVSYRKKEIDNALLSMEKAGASGQRYDELRRLCELYRGEME